MGDPFHTLFDRRLKVRNGLVVTESHPRLKHQEVLSGAGGVGVAPLDQLLNLLVQMVEVVQMVEMREVVQRKRHDSLTFPF